MTRNRAVYVTWFMVASSGVFFGCNSEPKKGSTAGDSYGVSIGIVMKSIPAGTFQMGSDWEDDPRNLDKGRGKAKNDQPIHSVTVSAFEMSTTEVTVGQFRAFVNESGYRTEAERSDGSYITSSTVISKGEIEKKSDANWGKPYIQQGDDHPVVCVSWNDATAFCKWLSGKTGREYGLPTEAEWEYACRAGTKTLYNVGDTEFDLARAGWYFVNSGDKNLDKSAWSLETLMKANCRTHSVRQKIPNTFGLYDMHGNAKEWCNDWIGSYSGESQTNPTGTQDSSFRVVRGGSWADGAGVCRSAYRNGFPPDFRCDNLGFRIVRRTSH